MDNKWYSGLPKGRRVFNHRPKLAEVEKRRRRAEYDKRRREARRRLDLERRQLPVLSPDQPPQEVRVQGHGDVDDSNSTAHFQQSGGDSDSSNKSYSRSSESDFASNESSSEDEFSDESGGNVVRP